MVAERHPTTSRGADIPSVAPLLTLILLLAAAVLVVSCGGGGGAVPVDIGTPPPVPTPVPTKPGRIECELKVGQVATEPSGWGWAADNHLEQHPFSFGLEGSTTPDSTEAVVCDKTGKNAVLAMIYLDYPRSELHVAFLERQAEWLRPLILDWHYADTSGARYNITADFSNAQSLVEEPLPLHYWSVDGIRWRTRASWAGVAIQTPEEPPIRPDTRLRLHLNPLRTP